MVMVDTFKCYNVVTYLNIYFIQLQVFSFLVLVSMLCWIF